MVPPIVFKVISKLTSPLGAAVTVRSLTIILESNLTALTSVMSFPDDSTFVLPSPTKIAAFVAPKLSADVILL